jgi:hypothetical protein
MRLLHLSKLSDLSVMVHSSLFVAGECEIPCSIDVLASSLPVNAVVNDVAIIGVHVLCSFLVLVVLSRLQGNYTQKF